MQLRLRSTILEHTLVVSTEFSSNLLLSDCRVLVQGTCAAPTSKTRLTLAIVRSNAVETLMDRGRCSTLASMTVDAIDQFWPRPFCVNYQ